MFSVKVLTTLLILKKSYFHKILNLLEYVLATYDFICKKETFKVEQSLGDLKKYAYYVHLTPRTI